MIWYLSLLGITVCMRCLQWSCDHSWHSPFYFCIIVWCNRYKRV
nr:MAG TPA: hypothetical protein [Bacteriophage sp.]